MSKATPGKEMPFLDHLEELRWRLLWSIGALVGMTIAGFFAVNYFDLVGVIGRPAIPYLPNGTFIYTHPADPFTIKLMLSFSVGIVLASPIILFQAWGFVAPALYPHEKRVGGYVLAGGLVLFSMGVALAQFFVLPAAMAFFDGFGGPSMQGMLTAREYFSFAVTLALTFGIAFELPIVIVGLTALGLVTPQFLRRYRRHAFVLCVVGAALVTPGDYLVGTVALIIPLYLLYELGIFLSRGVYKWRQRRENSIGDSNEGANEAQAHA
jgi:sec-independent protein translocase protein TatC